MKIQASLRLLLKYARLTTLATSIIAATPTNSRSLLLVHGQERFVVGVVPDMTGDLYGFSSILPFYLGLPCGEEGRGGGAI